MPKLSRFFPFPLPFCSFCVSVGVLSWNFGGLKRRNPQMCTLGVLKHHQNSTRRHPERHKKSEMVAGEGKIRTKFWVVRRSPNPQPHQLQHLRNGRVEARISVPEGWGAKGLRRVGAPSPRVLGFRSECWSFGLGPACVQTPSGIRGGTRRGEKDEITFFRGYRLVGVAKPPVTRKGG